jgi:formate--tetrahydrofolate ligase
VAKTTLPSSLEIAQAATLRPITDIASEIGLEPHEVELYGRYKAKVSLDVLDRLGDRPDGKLIDVTAITPTPAGEGKTTTSVSLTQGFGKLGKSTVLCLREASLGPVFGIKGGAAGGGYTQVVPMEDMNLHFTGDIHAIGAANNLLAAMLEAHLLHGNTLGIDPLSISWRRCVDINDRALRDIVVGIGGRANGYTRQTGFDITAASEVMAIVAVARDLHDLRSRLGAITVGQTYEGEPVTAEQLKAAGAMTVLLKDTIKPNLVQTLEGQPVFVHCGPFANIAHGNNSLVADRVALKLGDYVVTESGFGSDMGMEKFFDIVCRVGALRPSATVLVATVKALKHHGGDQAGGLAEIEAGAANLARHLGIVREFGLNAVVAVNRFPTDTQEETDLVKRLALEAGAYAAEVNDGFERGGEGAAALAEAVAAAADESNSFDYLYPLDAPIEKKIEAIAVRAYGADGIFLLKTARDKIAQFNANGLDTLPICMAKTHLSLSHDLALTNAPTGFVVTIRDIRAYTGAGWLVALCGDMQTMPGLSAMPAAFNVDIDDDGRTVGLF